MGVTPIAKKFGLPGNWRASFMFGLVVILVRIAFHFGDKQPTLVMAVIYACVAGLCLFFFDWVGGFVLAVIGFLIALEFVGILPNYPRQIIGEITFLLGVLFCALSGPSGGIFKPSHFLRRRRRFTDNLGGSTLH
jgi:hypothetical protein